MLIQKRHVVPSCGVLRADGRGAQCAVNANQHSAAFDGAVRHVPGSNPGLKVPTPDGVQVVPPSGVTYGAAPSGDGRGEGKGRGGFSHRFIISIHYAPYGGPKGGRPVVEERRRDNDQGGTSTGDRECTFRHTLLQGTRESCFDTPSKSYHCAA